MIYQIYDYMWWGVPEQIGFGSTIDYQGYIKLYEYIYFFIIIIDKFISEGLTPSVLIF